MLNVMETVMENDDRQAFHITTKGFFVVELMKHNISCEQSIEIWNSLHAFVATTAKDNGYKRGFPAVVFDGKGGTCIKIPRDV